jgi:hypothetical protein
MPGMLKKNGNKTIEIFINQNFSQKLKILSIE